jgi:hypothetical protein
LSIGPALAHGSHRSTQSQTKVVKMLDPRPAFTAYIERLNARPALQRADKRNDVVRAEHDLKMPGG